MPSVDLPSSEIVPMDGALPATALRDVSGTPFGFYLHIPFCATRCGYCDFNTYTALELTNRDGTAMVSQSSYIDLVLREIDMAADVLGPELPTVSTVFVGGGTPSLLPAGHLAAAIEQIRSRFPVADDVEITTEANPESVSGPFLSRLREAGFTRVSLGMQSAAPHVLAVLDRTHTPGRAAAAVEEARAAGFEHINVDLIYGTPGETDDDWARSLDAAIATGVDHVSAYALIVEEGTALARRIARGQIAAPDDDVHADRYEQAEAALTAAGFEWYEVSNWSRGAAGRCRHNELYWHSANWWGVGPGAHSHVGGVRWWNVRHPAAYAGRLDQGLSPAQGRETLTADQMQMEQVMLRLRCREGLDLAELAPGKREDAEQMVTYGLIDRAALGDGRIVLTLRGRLLADSVIRSLVD